MPLATTTDPTPDNLGRVRIAWLNSDGTTERRTWMQCKALGRLWALGPCEQQQAE